MGIQFLVFKSCSAVGERKLQRIKRWKYTFQILLNGSVIVYVEAVLLNVGSCVIQGNETYCSLYERER